MLLNSGYKSIPFRMAFRKIVLANSISDPPRPTYTILMKPLSLSKKVFLELLFLEISISIGYAANGITFAGILFKFLYLDFRTSI